MDSRVLPYRRMQELLPRCLGALLRFSLASSLEISTEEEDMIRIIDAHADGAGPDSNGRATANKYFGRRCLDDLSH